MKSCIQKLFVLIPMLSLCILWNANAAERTVPVIPSMDSPEVILQKAKLSRDELLSSINNLKKNIPNFQHPEQFFPYFNMLGQLQEIAQKQSPNINEIYPNAVVELGAEMASFGIRWLDARKDSKTKVLSFHQWIQTDERLEIAFRFLEATGKNIRITSITDTNALQSFAQNLNALKDWAQKKFPNQLVLITSYQSAATDIAIRALQNPALNLQNKKYWIHQISQPTGFDTYLQFLQKEIFSIGENNKQYSHSAFQLLVLAYNRLNTIVTQERSSFPIGSANQFGNLLQELVVRMIKLGVTFEKEEFSVALKIMQPAHLQNLANQWMGIVNPSLNLYGTQYAELAKVLVNALNTNNLAKEGKELNTFVEKMTVPSILKNMNLEGNYLLTGPQGEKWGFTLAYARKDFVIAALSDIQGFAPEGFFYVGYNSTTNEFTAFERDPSANIDPSPNPHLTFKFQGNTIVVQARGKVLTGSKISSFTDYQNATSVGAITLSPGKFSGTIYYPNYLDEKGDAALPMELTLIPNGLGFLGRLSNIANPSSVFSDFTYCNNNNEGYLYLTTGVINNTSWVQIRVKVVDNYTLSGVVIVGGRGESKKSFILRRVQ